MSQVQEATVLQRKLPLRILSGATADLQPALLRCRDALAMFESPDVSLQFVHLPSEAGAGSATAQRARELLRQCHVYVLFAGAEDGEAVRSALKAAVPLGEAGTLSHLFVFTGPSPGIPLPAASGAAPADTPHREPRRHAPRTVRSYASTAQLMNEFPSLVRDWLEASSPLLRVAARWNCQQNENLFASMRLSPRPFSRDIVVLQGEVDGEDGRKRSLAAYQRYVHTQEQFQEVEYYLVARFLFTAILEGRYEVCQYKPFIWPIHQFLSDSVRSSSPPIRQQFEGQLLRWLLDRRRVYDTSRDFAAFQLGMCRFTSAEPHLLAMLSDPRELFLVRYYGTFALGMLRMARSVRPLVELYQAQSDERLMELMGHVILYITQLTEQRADVVVPEGV